MSALFDSTLDMNKGTPVAPTSRTSKFKSPQAQQQNPPSRAAGRSSADDIFESLLGSSSKAAARSPNARNTTNDASRDKSDSLFGDLSLMLDPQNNTRQPARKNNSVGGPPALPEPPALKLNASLGRTVSVDSSRGMDVGRAFRALDMAVNRNQVKRHERLQRFHERPGMKRKRLKSERWRRRFKEGFRAIVKRVQGMKAQGW